MRSQAGQAVVDYLALVTVLVVLGIGAAALGTDPSSIGGGITRAFARGLCIVESGVCDVDQRPCVVASERREREEHLNLVVFSIGRSRYLLRERRSDGTVALTAFHDRHGRLGGSKGGSIRLAGLTLGGEVSLGIMLRNGSGATYLAGSAAEADRLERALRGGSEDLPRPAETFGETQTKRDYGAGVSVQEEPLAELGFHASDRDRTRVAADGSRTISIAPGQGWSASVLGRELAGADEADESFAVRLDPAGRPLELVVTAIGSLDGDARLPELPSAMADALRVPAGADRIYAVETHLDLTDPANAALARDFVDDVRHPRVRIGRVPAPTARLRARLREAGLIEGRSYAIASATDGSAGSIGIGSSERVEVARLLGAVSRGLDGRWRLRDDCVADATETA